LEQTQEHNICGPGDVDWMAFPAQKDQVYKIEVSPSETSTNLNLQLFGADKTTVITQANAAVNYPMEMKWAAPGTGVFYLRISAVDPMIGGTGVRYQVMVQQVLQVNTPTFFFSALVLPIIWSLFKAFSFLRRRFTRE
jgi:hypothetical protein